MFRRRWCAGDEQSHADEGQDAAREASELGKTGSGVGVRHQTSLSEIKRGGLYTKWGLMGEPLPKNFLLAGADSWLRRQTGVVAEGSGG